MTEASPNGDVVVTWDEAKTRILAVTRQDAEGKVLSVIAEAPAQGAQEKHGCHGGDDATMPQQAEAVPSRSPMQDAGRLKYLIGAYWDLAYKEGQDGRRHDTPQGSAANCLHEINRVIDALVAPDRVVTKVAHRACGNPDEQFDFSALLRPSIHEMATQAGAARFYPAQQSTKDDAYIVSRQFLERFAELAAALALEDAAKLCEQTVERPVGYGGQWEGYGPIRSTRDGLECATAIRALKDAP